VSGVVSVRTRTVVPSVSSRSHALRGGVWRTLCVPTADWTLERPRLLLHWSVGARVGLPALTVPVPPPKSSRTVRRNSAAYCASDRQQFQIWAASRDPWWMRRARPPYRVPDAEWRALSTLQRIRFCRVDKRSASTISLAAGTLPVVATQIWNC
jgi:hypothetical protein